MLLKNKRINKKNIPVHIIVFLSPAIILYTVFMIYPIFDSLILSFFKFDINNSRTFVGFQNYMTLITDSRWQAQFLNALKNSSVFFAINMLIQNPIALLLAALLATKVKGGAIYRTLLYTPTTLSLVIVAFVWQLLLNPMWGITKNILSAIGLGTYFRPWLGLENTALIALALISSWQYIGVPILLYYASLIGIPKDLLDAARVDGASNFKIFWKVKFPLIMPIVGIVSLMTYVFNFNAFDIIYALKGPLAGPNFSTDTMMTFFFRTYFGHEFQQSNPIMGTTIAGTMFLLLMIGVLIYFFWQRRIENYEL
jgi:raffinose/stachyose/melibiose transport system permease protein